MKANILRLLDDVRGSYWFLPTLMAIAAMALAGGMIFVDSHAGSEWMDGLPWLYAARPDGARQVLSAISGSMITVAGTVFSITIAAVVYATGQYGPRLLNNFMNDRGNQITLGTFIATFVYCLLVLRTIRSADERGGGEFVPNMALLIGVALALCSIAVLIFFIHHVPSKLHINNVIEDVGGKLLAQVERRFPRLIGAPQTEDAGKEEQIPPTFRREANAADEDLRSVVTAEHTGYLQVIDDQALIAQARAHDLVVRLRYQSGDFVHAGRALLEISPPERHTEALADAMRSAFAVGSRRTALQDLRFLVDELVEIGARALSPGVNDPFTAVTCLDWLGAAVSEVSKRQLPSPLRADEDGALRMIAQPVSFRQFLDRSFGALAQYCADDMVAGLAFVRALGEASLGCDDAQRLRALGEVLTEFEGLVRERLIGFNQERVLARGDALRQALFDPDAKRRLRDTAAWLGGSA